MKYKTLLKKLQKFSKQELEQNICLFYGDGGSYSEVIDLYKTQKEHENLGCEGIDAPSDWKKGQWVLIYST